MVTYIYFVKCPNCEDEHFDFFDDAKAFAMGCLSQKPIITQTEVCRNDFGECTDSADLGQVWSWEDECQTEAEPTTAIFTKDDFKAFEGGYNPENDPEFYNMDNSVDFEPETPEVSAVDEVPDNFRKPIPEGMTIEQLVEEMEENEDTVECVLCQDLFDKSTCRKELNLGWLCHRCADDLTARGEGPVFKEDNYWDFLDEDAELHDLGNEYDGSYPATQTWGCYFDGVDIGTVEAATEDEALEKMQQEYPEYPYGLRHEVDIWVEPAEGDSLTESTLTEAAGYDCPKLREAENNKPGIAKFKILYQFRKNPDVQGPYGDCPYLSGVSATATFKNVRLQDSTKASYGEVYDIELADNGEVMLTTTNGKKYSLRHALRIASPVTDKFSNTRKVLLALKAAVEAAEKTLDTKTVRNLRVRNALEKLDDAVANEFKAHIKNITFRIPAHNAYSANDILDIDPDASEQQAELAAERINRIHDAFYSLPFAKQAEAEGIVEERIPTENVGWILSSWGAVGKIRFDCPISSLSDAAQDIIKKAKLSEDEVKTGAFEIDCYRLATELIRFFGNDPKFYEKPVESVEPEAADEAFDLDFPEV